MKLGHLNSTYQREKKTKQRNSLKMAQRSPHPPHHPAILTHERAKKAMDKIATLLKDCQPITIGEVIKGGSLGHGTAVPGDFDLDLVIYSPDIEPDEIRSRGFEKWLDILEDFMKKQPEVRFTKRTIQAVQFKYDDVIDVDLLVSPLWNNQWEFYDFLKTLTAEERFSFSVCGSKWQVEFFHNQPNQVKELIKRAKVWRNATWNDGRPNKPKSYLISLLVVRAYEIASRTVSTSNTKLIAEKTTQELQHLIHDRKRMDCYWNKLYTVTTSADTDTSIFPKSIPRLVDPANPSNNLYDTGIMKRRSEKSDDAWRELEKNIDTINLKMSY